MLLMPLAINDKFVTKKKDKMWKISEEAQGMHEKHTFTKLLHYISVYVCLCKSFDTMLKLNVTNLALYQRNSSSFEIKRMYHNEIKVGKGLIFVICHVITWIF